MGLYDKPESFKPQHWFWIIGLGLLYALYTATSWSTGYIDFGDGNYMYISWRLAEGAVVYRDILAPQPPAHLFLGAGLVKLGDALRLIGGRMGLAGLDTPLTNLYLFRIFSLLLHLATYALVLRLAWRAWGRPLTTVLAGAIWLWLPINTWWSLGYQSEPLEIFFLLLMMTAALRVTAIGDLWAGIFAALAALTNATAAPFLLVLIVFMIVRAPLRALRLTAPCVLLAGAVVFALERWTGGAFLQNAIFNQVGTYPSDSLAHFLNYAVDKLVGQGGKVLALEGVFFVLALLGLIRYLNASPLDAVSCAGLGWFFAATLCALVYVTKGGTEDYIFNLSEPAVAILAAGELVAWGRRWTASLSEPHPDWALRVVPFWPLKAVATALLAVLALGPGLNFHSLVRSQRAYELDAAAAERIAFHLKKAAAPGDRVLAPPFYAVLARRRLWSDYSELFIWQMKYWNDRKEDRPDGEGWAKGRAMAEAIARQELPVVILEMDQTGTFPEVMKALQAAYVPQPSPLGTPGGPAGFITPTLNTRLAIFHPLGEPTRERVAEQKERWRLLKQEMLRYWGFEGVQRKFRQWYDLEAVLAPPAPPATRLSITPIIRPHAGATTQTQIQEPNAITTVTLTTATRAVAPAPAPALPTRMSQTLAPTTATRERLPATPKPTPAAKGKKRRSPPTNVNARPGAQN